MSAYVVSDFHINTIVTWAGMRKGAGRVGYYWQGKRRYIDEDLQRVASVLHAENVRSVNARYEESDPAHGFRFVNELARVLPMPAVQIIKACHGYAYQADEAGGWNESEARAIVQAIEQAAVMSLPGYERAAWHLG